MGVTLTDEGGVTHPTSRGLEHAMFHVPRAVPPFLVYAFPMQHHDFSGAGLPMSTDPLETLPLLQCTVTHLLVGATLEDTQRYAETIAARLEAAIDALEALGAARRAFIMRGWLERWLRIVEQLFEQRLEERQALFGTQA
jgi:hypothetical protein